MVIKFSAFQENKGSSPHSQKPAIGPYQELADSSYTFAPPFLHDPLLYILQHTLMIPRFFYDQNFALILHLLQCYRHVSM